MKPVGWIAPFKRASRVRADTSSWEANFARTLELVVDRAQLQAAILGYLKDLFQAETANLLVWSETSGGLEEDAQRGNGSRMTLAPDSRLVRWLEVNGTPLDVGRQLEVLGHLSTAEREWLARRKVEVCIPLLAMNRLVGVALLAGLRQPEQSVPPYVLTQMGLALQNAAPHSQQQLRLRRLSRAERLATTGQLAASAAHEIRNPLTAISSAVQLLGEAFEQSSPRREVADGAIREIDRINQIVEGLLSFSRPTEARRETVHLVPVLEEALRLTESSVRRGSVEAVSEFATEQDALQGDRGQLLQVFVNLLLNGVQAMPEGGQLTVRLDRPKGLCVDIVDTGVGMTSNQIEHAFDPFFTTKETGTGLGLAICYGIVRAHGGEIDIQSRPGEGTTVRVEL